MKPKGKAVYTPYMITLVPAYLQWFAITVSSYVPTWPAQSHYVYIIPTKPESWQGLVTHAVPLLRSRRSLVACKRAMPDHALASCLSLNIRRLASTPGTFQHNSHECDQSP